MREQLKPCPNCGETEITMFEDGTECPECGMTGPLRDPAGSKWNALPRRGEAGQPVSRADELPPCAVCGKMEAWHCYNHECIDHCNGVADHAYIDPRTVPPRPSTGPDGKPWAESAWELLPLAAAREDDVWCDSENLQWYCKPGWTPAETSFNGLRWRAQLRAELPPAPVTVEQAVAAHLAVELRGDLTDEERERFIATERRFLAQQEK